MKSAINILLGILLISIIIFIYVATKITGPTLSANKEIIARTVLLPSVWYGGNGNSWPGGRYHQYQDGPRGHK